MRQFCSLRHASSFNDLSDTIDSSVIGKLASVYSFVYLNFIYIYLFSIH